jgi:hypothetical protein
MSKWSLLGYDRIVATTKDEADRLVGEGSTNASAEASFIARRLRVGNRRQTADAPAVDDPRRAEVT